ncbi:MAG: ABC transporter substrate-binding protein [Promethearchaeota archaeon]
MNEEGSILGKEKLNSLMAGIALIGLLCTNPLSTCSQVIISSKWSSEFRPHGGFVDKIMFHVYTAIETPLAMAALQTGEIDAYDEQVQQNYLAAVVRDENIEVTFTPSVRYQALTLNCERFPTNITAFRRAMAFGFDKYRANVEVIGSGVGQPQDSYIPLIISEWEVESALAEHFYESDYISGNRSLENAGFKNLDIDGWREYDKNNNGVWDPGIDLDDDEYVNGTILQLYALEGSDPAIRMCDIMVDGLEEMGVRAETVVMDNDFILDAVFAGNHWCVFWIESCPVINIAKILYDRFRTGAQWNREPYNYYHYSNSTIDAILDNMVDATNIEDVKQYALDASLLLTFEQPQIVYLNYVNIGAHRNDEFEGFFKAAGLGVTSGENWAVTTKIHLKESLGGPYGGIFDYCLSGEMGTWNPYLKKTQYEATVFQYIYEYLWNFDPFTWDPIPGLAYDWEIEQTTANGDIRDGQKFTFYLYQNETWHDGEHFTAADINHSIYMWRDSPFHSPNMWDIYETELPDGPDGHVIELYVNETGYFEWADTTRFLITPKHIWGEVENVTSYSPEINQVIGTGPYMLQTWVPGESITLERHEDWRWDTRHTGNGHIFSTIEDEITLIPPTTSVPTTKNTFTPNSSSTRSSYSSIYLVPSFDLIPVLQMVELGTILFFVITVVIIIRRNQLK